MEPLKNGDIVLVRKIVRSGSHHPVWMLVVNAREYYCTALEPVFLGSKGAVDTDPEPWYIDKDDIIRDPLVIPDYIVAKAMLYQLTGDACV